MFKTDYHLHTNRSFDGQMTIFELCEKAIDLGFSDIAITDHCECNALNVLYDYDLSKKDYLIAKEKYKGKIAIKFGIEIGQPTQNLEYANKLLDNANYDFIIGSLHNNENELDYLDLDYGKIDIDEYLTKYYNEILQMCNWGKFDVLGHLDYPSRYLARVLAKYDMLKYKDEIAKIFLKLINDGKGIEVNTSTTKDILGRTMPQFELIKLYKDLGGQIITIGSDAHKTEYIGLNFENAREQIINAGFKYISIFENRKASYVKLD